MTGFTVHCPRCKLTFSADDADELADALLDHVEKEHGHGPPREHVLARIERSTRLTDRGMSGRSDRRFVQDQALSPVVQLTTHVQVSGMHSGLHDHVQQDLAQRGVRRLTTALKPPSWLRV